MPTQIALDKADPAVADLVDMLSTGESITFEVTAIPVDTEEAVVLMDVTDINVEVANEPERVPPSQLMPETQLKESGFDTGPVAPTKNRKPTQRPNQPHQ